MKIKAIGTKSKGGKTTSILREIEYLDGNILLINDEHSAKKLFGMMNKLEVNREGVYVIDNYEDIKSISIKSGKIKHILIDCAKISIDKLKELIIGFEAFELETVIYSFQLDGNGCVQTN